MKKEVDVILFSGLDHLGDLRREYPELAGIDEFKSLRVKEVRFCWLVGNRTSPIFRMERPDRVLRAVKIVYGENYSKRPALVELSKGEFSEGIIAGMRKMASFNPEIRLKAKLLDEYIFDTLREIISITDQERMAMDTDEKAKFSTLVIKVGSELEAMVKRLENSYGVKTIDKKTGEKVLVNINQL